MRAIHIARFGAPTDAIEIVDVPEPPAPKSGEVLVSILYAPVNPNDLLVMGGQFPHKPALGTPLGNEGVGRVLGVGKGVENVKLGDLVTPPLYSGTWRERMVFPADGLFPLPALADVKQLAMMRINPPTAALLLSEYAQLGEGASAARLVDFLSAGSPHVGYAIMSGEPSTAANLPSLARKDISLDFFYQNRPEFRAKVPALLPQIARMIASGAIKVPIAAIYSLDEIQDAIAKVQDGGKVLLKIGE